MTNYNKKISKIKILARLRNDSLLEESHRLKILTVKHNEILKNLQHTQQEYIQKLECANKVRTSSNRIHLETTEDYVSLLKDKWAELLKKSHAVNSEMAKQGKKVEECYSKVKATEKILDQQISAFKKDINKKTQQIDDDLFGSRRGAVDEKIIN
tara:strand:- start:126 stop:590 length:465 start_codon:yes stop_codon:yes gene_type:complete